MKVIFDLSAQQIVIEGDGVDLLKVIQAARDIAPNLPKIQISMKHDSAPKSHREVTPATNFNNGHAGQTMKQFVKALKLDNAAERITAIAYYVKRWEGKDVFSPKEMGEWFTICGFQKPSQMPVAIFDSKRKYGYLESGGHSKWRLTTNGENLVVSKLNQSEDEGSQA